MSFTEDINTFNSLFSYKELKVTGGSFTYLFSKKDNSKCLVFLNGGTNSSQMWMKYVIDLSKDYSVLIFDYSIDLKNIQSQAIGMNELFISLGIVNPILIGASFGGIMAQIYTQKFPSQVGSLILLSTGAVTEETIKGLKPKKIFLPLLLWVIKHFNYDKLKVNLITSTMKYVKDESEEVQQYSKEMFTYVFKDYTAEKDYHITSLLGDIFNQQYVTKDTFSCLKDKILLILPKKDYFSPKMQEDLIHVMSNPKVEYVDGGHIATVLYVEKYLSVIRSFLENL